MSDKKTIAVVFGGRSVEHDVSILTGLQVIEAMDPTRFTPLPIYVDPDGRWWTGSYLLDRKNYPYDSRKNDGSAHQPVELTLDLASATEGQPRVMIFKKGLLGVKQESLGFDLLIPAIHGSNGEDGSLQGLLEFANIPYSGCRPLGAAICMDKLATKHMARDADLRVLPEVAIERPQKGKFLDPEQIEKRLIAEFGSLKFPLVAKPVTLGSSVGVTRVADMDGLMGALLDIFKMDSRAMVEPCVEPLVEYNIAVRRAPDGSVQTSAIERPKTEKELLDFATKYLGGSKKMGGAKAPGSAEGMVSQTRTLHPDELGDDQVAQIRHHAATLFDTLDLAGSVRVDFLANGDTGEIWLNEANTVPGSFAFFLWEAADVRVSFLDLVGDMIDEGERLYHLHQRQTDVHTGGAKIFGRDS